jgi:hypothetical protein
MVLGDRVVLAAVEAVAQAQDMLVREDMVTMVVTVQ